MDHIIHHLGLSLGGRPAASFAKRLRAAVHAAITQPWSNGQVEAQITKLKLVKRQMYGRANLDLLQARLLGAP
jgi:transposase